MMRFKLILFFLSCYPILNFGQITSIKSAEISFNFEAKDVDGTISGFSSDSQLDFENIQNSKLKGSVAVKTIKTGIFLRDWALKGNKYFNEDLHPKIYFESTNIQETNTGFSVQGNLTIKAIAKPMRITFVKNGNKLIGTAIVKTSEYGINIKKHPEDNTVKVKLIFTLH
ncbi:YceI family protein [Aurantibacter sp.]|uniref:YceI family protein n=1 Tax=Aurantibacter sp. TaxID=2807103 RepID=UPI00326420C4